MTKAQVEVITSVQRRRRWSQAEKERIVAAAMEPGAVASEVARAAGIHSSQLFRWRQQLCERVQIPTVFNPQAQIYARQGINLDRSTLADWVGRAAWLLRPVHERLLMRLKSSTKLFADETTAPW